MEKLTMKIALAMAKETIDLAEKDADDPIAVTVVGTNGKTIITIAMDDVMPISVDLSFKKAYTAVMTKKDTIEWEKTGRDLANFADSNITFLGGGVLILSDEHEVIGAIGVSGRKTYRKDGVIPPQDDELARAGLVVLYEVAG